MASGIRDTYVFDGRASRRGAAMNSMLVGLRDPAERAAFVADEAGHCRRHGMTPEQTACITGRDWVAMLDGGSNIFLMYKLAQLDGVSMQHLGGVFRQMSEAEFAGAMSAGGLDGGLAGGLEDG